MEHKRAFVSILLAEFSFMELLSDDTERSMPLEEELYYLQFLRGGHTMPHRATRGGSPVWVWRQEE